MPYKSDARMILAKKKPGQKDVLNLPAKSINSKNLRYKKSPTKKAGLKNVQAEAVVILLS